MNQIARPTIGIDMEREQVDVTRSGLLPPYEADHSRKFIPGMKRWWLTLDNRRITELTHEQADDLRRALTTIRPTR